MQAEEFMAGREIRQRHFAAGQPVFSGHDFCNAAPDIGLKGLKKPIRCQQAFSRPVDVSVGGGGIRHLADSI